MLQSLWTLIRTQREAIQIPERKNIWPCCKKTVQESDRKLMRDHYNTLARQKKPLEPKSHICPECGAHLRLEVISPYVKTGQVHAVVLPQGKLTPAEA